MANLTEDEVDDILYFARANELQDLQTTLSEYATTHSTTEVTICAAALDPTSQNTPLHYAAANGHIGATFALLASDDN
jgi:hypothetical protein